MGYVDVAGVEHTLPDGRVLFANVSFRVGEGAKVALVGPNGAGKTTLLRMVAGDVPVRSGTIARAGGLGVMRQFIGSIGDETTLGALALSLAEPRLAEAGARLAVAEKAMHEAERRGKFSTVAAKAQLRYAEALTGWGEAGGYEAEVLFDTASVAVLGQPWESTKDRPVRTLSGGQQKRFALELLLRGTDEVLLLDEPDNFLDVPAKRWLETRLRECGKTVLYVSHDRELLAQTADRVVAVEGGSAWVHPGGFESWHAAREARHERLEERRRRWDEEHQKLRELMLMYKQKAAYNSDMASRYQAAVTRLKHFEEAGPTPLPPRDQEIRMRLSGGRTGKSHFLRLLAGEPVAHEGSARLGARVRPGHFSQTHDRPDLVDRTLADILWRGDEHRAGLPRPDAMRALSRYELAAAAEQRFGTLSGGQQARFLVVLLELSGSTLLLLDEPTDNLDLASAEALEDGLRAYEGTVVAVTHDRWFARSFDRFVLFGADGDVAETDGPVWDV